MPSALADPPKVAGTEATESSPVEPFDEIIVRLQRNDAGVTLAINQVPVESMDALATRLREIADLGVQPPVIVDPDWQVPVGFAIEVYDLARRQQFDRVLFVADSE